MFGGGVCGKGMEDGVLVSLSNEDQDSLTFIRAYESVFLYLLVLHA